ncbi:MAG TPA: hypothetical protein VFT19_00725 [Solirubrobacterales bacterium]|nr:hypothetical protein [Solirubrobacterales bacterium]
MAGVLPDILRPGLRVVFCGTATGTGEFDVAGLEARIAAVEPASLAFNGKNAAHGALGRRVDYGPQPELIGAAALWVLPSTSGAARRYWDVGPWRELARACAES